jgi:hypothetical protein
MPVRQRKDALRKAIRPLAILAFCTTVFIGLAGCSLLFPSDQTSGSVVGTWQAKDPSSPDSFTMTLTAGLAFTDSYSYGSTAHTYSGTYTSDTSSIVFTTTVIDGLPIGSQIATANYSFGYKANSMILNYISGTPAGAPTTIPLARI